MYASYEMAVAELGGEERLLGSYAHAAPDDLRAAVEQGLEAASAEIDAHLARQIPTPATEASVGTKWWALLPAIEITLYAWSRFCLGARKPPEGLDRQAKYYRQLLGQIRDGQIQLAASTSTAAPYVGVAGTEKTGLTAELFETARSLAAWD